MAVVKVTKPKGGGYKKVGAVKLEPAGTDETISLEELRLRELMEKSHDSDVTVIPMSRAEKFKRKYIEKQKV